MEKKDAKMTALGTGAHSISVTDRKEINLTGVLDVKSFDELEVLLETELGVLLVKGKNLAVKSLSHENGNVKIEGELEAMVYTRQGVKKNKESLAKRLFS